MSEVENRQRHPGDRTSPLLQNAATVLFRRKREVLAIFFTVLGGVALATAWMPRTYKAEMKILVKNERADLVVSPDANSGSSSYPGDVNENRINSEIELVSSSDLLQQVVRQCHLYEEDRLGANASADPSPIALD